MQNLGTLARIIGTALAIGALALVAAGNGIGTAVSGGSLKVNHSEVWGNATLFDGTLVETTNGYSQLQLDKGVIVRLAAESRATVHNDRMTLERGQSEIEAANSYEVEARSLHILAAAPGTQARVKLADGHTVVVAALHGALRVSNASGVLIARVEAGNTLTFDPQPAGAAAPTRASGCLLTKSGNFILAERTNKVILELTGSGLESEVGNQVEITGKAEAATPRLAEASQVIKVAGIRLLNKGGCASMAKKVGAAAAAGAGTGTAAAGVGSAAGAGTAGAAAGAGAAAATGIGVGTVAVIGGVATAATVGGLAAAGELPGQGASQSQASR